MNWRRSEWISFATLLTISGWIWWASSRTVVWDETANEVKTMEPRLVALERENAEIRAINTTQMSMIIRELDGLHREIKRNGG